MEVTVLQNKILKAFKSIFSFAIFAIFAQKANSVPAQTAQYIAQNAPKIGGGYAVTGQLSQVDYTTEVYDATNGLPTSDANYILGEKEGYIWICGYSGIIRYDGTTFEHLPTYFGLTSGRGLFEDSRKRLWVATNDNGVVVLENEKARHYTYNDGLSSSSIRIFAEDNKGNIFIGTTAGVCYVDKFGKLSRVSDPRINDERILRLDSDYNGRVYGQTKKGLIFSIDDCKITNVYSSKELGIETITTIMCDPLRPAKLYIGTESNSLYYGDFGSNVENLRKIDVSPLKSIHWISFDCGRVWVSSTTTIGWLDQYEHFFEVPNLPINSAIEMTTSDYQGNIWVASTTQGVMKIVTNNFVNLTKLAGLPKAVTNTTCFHNEKLYVGTDSGLRIINKDDKPVSNELTRYLEGARIRCLIEDKNNNLWIATYTKNMGLVCQAPDGKITSYTTDDGLPDNHIRCINITKDNKILCGSNGGLAIIKNGKIVKTVEKKDGIKNTEFLTVCEGDNGDIYCGSDGDGIYIVKEDGIGHLGRDEGLSSDVVMRIKKEPQRNLYWVITSNSIEYIINGEIKNIKSFPYNNNYDLYQNNNDEMWILSSYGIYTEKTEELVLDTVKDYRHYTIANGLPYSITSNSYSTLDDKGNLYICGREGVIRVNINHYFENTSLVKVNINSIFLDNQKIFHNPDGSYTIPASNGRIKITPAVMDYTMANPYIRLFLEGYDDFGQTVKRNALTTQEYTRLAYGNYTFHVQVLDNNKKNILVDERFQIIKRPRITELLIFKFLVIIILLLTVGCIVWRVMKNTVISRQYEQIRQAKDEADRANSAKSRFLSNMSQQLLTPINTILSMDEMILREEAKDVPKSYFMAMMNYAFDIRSASESLFTIINDLLEITKIESGKLQLIQQEYNVQEFLLAIVSQLRTRCLQKQLKFVVKIDEMLPKRLYGDVGKIKQVILKLLNNAIKFTYEGSITLKLSMESRTDDTCGLCFTVKDTGIGIKQEDVESLFSVYGNLEQNQRQDSEKLKTGLGLDISRKFAELMGGVLVCQSNYGEGSEFIFTLEQKIIDVSPIGIFTEQEEMHNRGPYIPQFIAPDADILIVEDNPMIVNVFRALLKATKVFVTTASSCEEAIDAIRTNTFHIVFLNQNIPGMDGEEAIQKIKNYAPDLPVYALTENGTDNEEYYISKGYNGFISIPVDSSLMERIIMRHLPQQIMEIPDQTLVTDSLNEIPQPLLWINDVKEINVEEGIKNTGSIGTFIFGLHLFYDTIDETVKRINHAYQKGDYKIFASKIRILKTSAKIIGASSFAELAQKMEEACNKDDKIYIGANLESFLLVYTSYKIILGRLNQE
ncbi:MAG: response regulator [Treponema sp.]|nr:response regulator [Treponema sp.]